MARPAAKLKCDGRPAGRTAAVTLLSGLFTISWQMAEMTGILLGQIRPSRPPGTLTGAEAIAPPAGETTENPPLKLPASPACKLVSPVVAVVLPSLIDPLGESAVTHSADEPLPSGADPVAASMAGLSTGQRVKAAQPPRSVTVCAALAGAAPSGASTATAAAVASTPWRAVLPRTVIAGFASLFGPEPEGAFWPSVSASASG